MLLTRIGNGRPLLLVHGLGNTRRAWDPVLALLAVQREVIAIDLPGHGAAPAEADSGSFGGLARSLEMFLETNKLVGADMVGSSLGAQLALEMARRGKTGAVVALDPGGFWAGFERIVLKAALTASAWSLRRLSPALPALAGRAGSRIMLMGQLSSRPWALDGDLVASQLAAFAALPTLDALIDSLAYGPAQQGPAAQPSGPVTIGWGRHDRLCLPVQAARALTAFPGARLHWFENSGHFPMWDEPDEAARIILASTGRPAHA